jgi:hypothetical protein
MSGSLPVVLAHQLAERPEEHRWLIQELWADEAVGVLGGEPKCCKSLLALDIAVAVASGTPCLRRYAVPKPGPVLLYAAEDALHVVRQRLLGICRAAGVTLESLDVHVITVPTLRLDMEEDRTRLAETVCVLGPRLLILDPFVRLHRRDENVSGDVAPLLAHLRWLQRMYSTAVLVVHHARKGGAHLRAGQALRGSSEFHAWGDSNLYMRRLGDELTLSVEHRAAPSVPKLPVQLKAEGDALALELVAEPLKSLPEQSSGLESAEQKIENALITAARPMALPELRAACRIRNANFRQTLNVLLDAGRIRRGPTGYELAVP